MSTKRVEERFDHVMNAAIGHHAAMVKHYNAAKSAVTMFKRSAYRFAERVRVMQDKYAKELQEFCATHMLTIDEWMDEHFAPIEQMYGDRLVFLRWVREGMTEDEYVEHGNLWGILRPSGKRGERAKAAAADVESALSQSAKLSDAEARKMLGAALKAAESTIREQGRDIGTLKREYEAVKKTLARLERIIAKSKRKAG